MKRSAYAPILAPDVQPGLDANSPSDAKQTPGVPKASLSLTDAIAIIIGTVVGAAIFETPALVAANSTSSFYLLLFWLLGGFVTLIGALCYAELASAYPSVGGTYFHLKLAFGDRLAFLFAWARMMVIQTGSIALLAFVFGDYASQLLSLGTSSSSIYAAAIIIVFTFLNIIGLKQGKNAQLILTSSQIIGLGVLVLVGLFATPIGPAAIEPLSASPVPKAFGLAMVFVLLTYGGWNEAAFISAEIHNRDRNIIRALLWSVGIITLTYMLVNFALLKGMGLVAMGNSSAVTAVFMRGVLGEPGAIFISLLIALCAMGSINATILTGARSNYALGRDFQIFRFMESWHAKSNSPVIAYVLQALIALALVALGTFTRGGFKTMIDYTAPVFWLFFLLSGISLLVLRRCAPQDRRPFSVPFYPFVPLLFVAVCGYLLYSSLVYTGYGALVGIGVVLLGLPLLLVNSYLSKR